MRALLFVVLCLSMAVCIIANFNLGERQKGDYIIINETMYKQAKPSEDPSFTIYMEAPLPNETINYVNISNVGDRDTMFVLKAGNIGTRFVHVLAIENLSEDIMIKVICAAIKVNTTTTEKVVDTTTSNEE